MEKEDILNKYRNQQEDEGKDHIIKQSDEYGFYAILGLAFLLTLYKIYMDLPFGDTGSIPLIYLAFNSFKHYHLTKDKEALSFGIVSALVALAFLIWYVIVTI